MTMKWTPERIKTLRRRMGLTQAEFAPKIGYGPLTSVSSLETGRRKPGRAACLLMDVLERRYPPAEKETGDQSTGAD